MFIRVNKTRWTCDLEGHLIPAQSGDPVVINIDKINTISDRYEYEKEYRCLVITTTTGEEIECIDLFDDIDKQLNYKFVRFKVWSNIKKYDFIYVLVNKDNVVSIRSGSFGTEIRFQDPFCRCLYVNESINEVIKMLG